MSRPSVTVAVPTYEPTETLAATLDSVDAQTYDGPISAVVVDTTETPAAEAIVEEFACADYYWQLDYIPRQPTGMANLAIARDLGVWFTDSDYVQFLDDGDLLHPEAVAKRVAAIEAHPQARGAYSAIKKADGTVKHVPPVVVDNPLVFVLATLRPPTLPSGLLVERAVLLDCPPRRTLPHEDICGLIEIMLRTPLAYVDEPLTIRTTPPEMSRSRVSKAGRCRTHERYAGLRSHLLDSRLHAHAELTYSQLTEQIADDDSC